MLSAEESLPSLMLHIPDNIIISMVDHSRIILDVCVYMKRRGDLTLLVGFAAYLLRQCHTLTRHALNVVDMF